MNLDEVLECVAEAEADRHRPGVSGRRYVLVEYDNSGTADVKDDAFREGGDEFQEDARAVGRIVAETSSVYEAFDLIASALAEESGYGPEELIADIHDINAGDDYEQWLDEDHRHYAPLLREIRSPGRRLLAYFVMGYLGPMDIVEADFWRDPYLGGALSRFPGARFVFLTSAAPPNHEIAFAILEHQPTGTPAGADRALMDACQRDGAIAAAVSAGAHANALDERGMSPLHLATAYRHPAAVAALLGAGADPNLQAEYGNAPHFAAVGSRQLAGPYAEQIDGAGHWAILRTLIEAGGRVNAINRTGATLLDLAIATQPYPREAVQFLVANGARSRLLEDKSLTDLLKSLPYYDSRRLQIRINEVRFLLDSGADKQYALHGLLGPTGYYEHELPGETLLQLVEELLRHGAALIASPDGRTPLDLAERWLAHGGHPNYQPVVDRLRAATSERT